MDGEVGVGVEEGLEVVEADFGGDPDVGEEALALEGFEEGAATGAAEVPAGRLVEEKPGRYRVEPVTGAGDAG